MWKHKIVVSGTATSVDTKDYHNSVFFCIQRVKGARIIYENGMFQMLSREHLAQEVISSTLLKRYYANAYLEVMSIEGWVSKGKITEEVGDVGPMYTIDT